VDIERAIWMSNPLRQFATVIINTVISTHKNYQES